MNHASVDQLDRPENTSEAGRTIMNESAKSLLDDGTGVWV